MSKRSPLCSGLIESQGAERGLQHIKQEYQWPCKRLEHDTWAFNAGSGPVQADARLSMKAHVRSGPDLPNQLRFCKGKQPFTWVTGFSFPARKADLALQGT